MRLLILTLGLLLAGCSSNINTSSECHAGCLCGHPDEATCKSIGCVWSDAGYCTNGDIPDGK
jgi:hypothetical protein